MLLDRYIFRQWTRLFLLTTLGFPVVAILIDLTDNLKTLLDRGIGPANIMLGYLYQFPEKMFEIIPAAVLFATVFTVGALGRHSELTAAKAGGISFHRLMLPIYLGALLATALCLGVEEVAPVTTEQKLQIHGDKSGKRSQRFNFVFRADRGWVYMIRTLDASTQRLLNRGARLTELLKQPQFSPLKMEEQVCVIYAGVNGYLDPLPVERVRAFETGLLALLRTQHSDLLASIGRSGDLSDADAAKLKDVVGGYARTFA